MGIKLFLQQLLLIKISDNKIKNPTIGRVNTLLNAWTYSRDPTYVFSQSALWT